MAAELTERVREIADARGVPESEVFERALERGVEAVGEERLRRAEREAEAVEEDVRWGLTA